MKKTAAQIATTVLDKLKTVTPPKNHWAELQKVFDAAKKQDQSFWGWLPLRK